MSDDGDDYLSDKFLLETAASTSKLPKTYSDIRKEAERKSKLKNEQNRIKGRRERELEAREDGLKKSLFARVKEEEDAGLNSGNKALSIMMKMGFKPGQSLGQTYDAGPSTSSTKEEDTEVEPLPVLQHKTEPLPLNEWEGRQGIGTRKRVRAPSPTAAERVAKMAKMEDDATRMSFRDRSRMVYEERRIEGRLGPVQRTCITLDEKDGRHFNVLWLDPRDITSFPTGLLDALAHHSDATTFTPHVATGDDLQSRLRHQMQADALRPLDDPNEDIGASVTKEAVATNPEYSSETLEEVVQFLRLGARDRFELLLSYLRERYLYCFWCGTQYDDEDDMRNQCPGPTEDDHD